MFYYNARYYNPTLGRFISKDPVLGRDGDSLSRNEYIYVKNNPLRYTDPSGETPEEALEKLKAQQEAWAAYIRNTEYSWGDYLQRAREFNYQKGGISGYIGGFFLGGLGDSLENLAKSGDPSVHGFDKGLAQGMVMLDVASLGKGTTAKNVVKEGLLKGVENKALRNVIEQLYRPLKEGVEIIGDGGAIDAAKYTMETGLKVGKTDHLKKLKDTVNALSKILKRENLNETETAVARNLKNRALDVLKGGGSK